MLSSHGLQTAGLHIHGDLCDSSNVQEMFPYWQKAATFAAAVASEFVLISGKPKPDKKEEDRQIEAHSLNKIGKMCQEHGVTLCYHNHYWEIEHDYKDLRFLVKHTDSDSVRLAIDIGWVHRAGGKAAEAAKLFLDRIRYFHFKDFRVKDFANDTWTELGNGYVDILGVLQVIKDRGPFWITVERDETLTNAQESAQISREYLRSLGY
jgi:sugar phosphate isomerase/epimerase